MLSIIMGIKNIFIPKKRGGTLHCMPPALKKWGGTCLRASMESPPMLLGKSYVSTTSSNDVKICTVVSGIPINSQIFSNTESAPVWSVKMTINSTTCSRVEAIKIYCSFVEDINDFHILVVPYTSLIFYIKYPLTF